MRFQHVGVVGAGVIGSGVAQLFAQTGHLVTLVDSNPVQLDVARRNMTRNLRLFGFLQKDQPAGSDVLARLRMGIDLGAIATVDFVIENVTEDWEIKQQVHREIDALVPPAVPVAVNTSAIPITRVADCSAP